MRAWDIALLYYTNTLVNPDTFLVTNLSFGQKGIGIWNSVAFNLFLLQYPASWLWLELETPERKRNYGPNQIPNVPCPIFLGEVRAQLDSGPHKVPRCVVALQERTVSFTRPRSISGCLGPTWELTDNMPQLYRSTPTKHSLLVVLMKNWSTWNPLKS